MPWIVGGGNLTGEVHRDSWVYIIFCKVVNFKLKVSQ